MLSKLAIIGHPINYSDIIQSVIRSYDKAAVGNFNRILPEFIDLKYVYLTNSGISSCYTILEIIKRKSKRKEVIIPAYTAESLVHAVVKAGLKPVLCDISFKDFNLDIDCLLKTISSDTLAVICVHMFGIGVTDISRLKEKVPLEIFLIEDCAQAMGSKVNGRYVGGFGDVSFFSFNRGKNMPTYGGGCVGTNSRELAESIAEEILKLPEQNLVNKLFIPFKILALSLAVRPLIYGLIYPFASHFKDVSLPHDFECRKITRFQAGLGLSLLKKMNELSLRRYRNGMFLIDSLKSCREIILPEISNDSRPAFNRLPVIFKDLKKLKQAEKKLRKAGIETSRMYLRPLHHMYDLGYGKDDFTNAVYFAEHLSTLPVHPLVRQGDLIRMAEIIKKA